MRRGVGAVLAVLLAAGISGCAGWRGANSLPLPGTEGHRNNPYTIQAQLADVGNIERNSRVRVADVTVGNVTKVERQDWHALVTMSLNGDVVLPANATATIGQTSLLGSLHVELAAPTDASPAGRLQDGALIPLSRTAEYPNTEQTLAAVSLLLNGGGLGQVHDITRALSQAFLGREDDLRSLLEQLDRFAADVDDQTADIIAAMDGVNNLVDQFAAQRPVLDRALHTMPAALGVLSDRREHLIDGLDTLGRFSALAADSTDKTRQSLVSELNDLGPVLQSLADAGPALTRSLSFLATFPWPNETLENWVRGDYANLTAVIDLTLSRLDASLFTGTRFEGHLTELELQWGRTIGQMPSPYTAGNPLIVPYHWDQGS